MTTDAIILMLAVYDLLKGTNLAFTILTGNGSQLAKMKKEYPCHAPAIKFIGMKQLV